MNLDSFWRSVEQALAEARSAATVDELMAALNRHHLPSSGEAFFGGSGGDNQLIDALRDNPHGWTMVWVEATYYWCAQDRNGALVSYVEGDLYRGDCRSS